MSIPSICIESLHINISAALITISTRASLKRYHSYTLTLGQGESGEEWDFHQIGTSAEKSSVDKELAELHARLAKVDDWKKRRQEIEDELNKVWVEGGDDLAPPSYLNESEKGPAVDESSSQTEDSLGQEESSFGQESLVSRMSSEA